MPKREREALPDKIPIDMTPMIDVVFQLLTFFIFSLNIVPSEGDFNIKMPLAAPREGQPDEMDLPPFRLRMVANSNGSLHTLRLDQRSLGTGISGEKAISDAFDALHQEVIARLGDERGPGSIAATAEVEIDADYNLHYENVISAITAVSGYRSDDKKNVIKLIEKIKFSPPRAAGASG